ncbi:hypothetical protein V2J09_000895 [Rumex salicifolius]
MAFPFHTNSISPFPSLPDSLGAGQHSSTYLPAAIASFRSSQLLSSPSSLTPSSCSELKFGYKLIEWDGINGANTYVIAFVEFVQIEDFAHLEAEILICRG